MNTTTGGRLRGGILPPSDAGMSSCSYFCGNSKAIDLKSSFGHLLAELGLVRELGDEVFEDGQSLGVRRLRFRGPRGGAEHITQVEEVLGQFQTKLGPVGCGDMPPL